MSMTHDAAPVEPGLPATPHTDAQAPDAEAAILGAALMATPAYDPIAAALEVLDDDDFAAPAHATIWQAICDLYGKGRPTSPIALAAELKKRGDLNRVGGPGYLHALAQQACAAGNVDYYAQLVRGRAVYRRFRESLVRGLHAVDVGDPEHPDDTITAHIADVEQLLAGTETDQEFERFGDILDAHLDALAQDAPPAAAITGFTDLDALMTLEPGQLIVVAARPAMGKSAFALGVATANARAGNPTLFSSLEMGRREVANRILAARARVSFDHLKRGRGGLTETDWDRLDQHTTDLRDAPLWLDYNTHVSPARLRSRIKTLARAHDGRPPLVVVDYLQLMQTDHRNARQTPYEKATEISRELKVLAKDTDTVVIALAQLNRGPEQRTDKKPQVSDLRDSGSIEQDADAVILLHREDYYEKESSRAGETDLIVAKHRNGPTTTITVAHQFHYSRLRDMNQT